MIGITDLLARVERSYRQILVTGRAGQAAAVFGLTVARLGDDLNFRR